MKPLFVLLISSIALNLTAQVEVSGTVKNYQDSSFYITETGNGNNLTGVWRDNRAKVIINKNRSFKVTIPEESIGGWYIKTEKGIQIFNLVKGEKLKIMIDFSRPNFAYAIGANAGDFNFSAFLHDSITRYYSTENFLQKIKNTNIDSVLFYRSEFAFYKMNLLNKYRSTHQMSDTYYYWLRSQFLYEPYERTWTENTTNLDSLDDVTMSKLFKNGINDDYAALNTREYNDLVSFYIHSKFFKISNKLTSTERFNYVTDSNMLSGSTRDVYLTRFMAGLIKKPDSVYNPLFKRYDQLVRNKEMKQQVISRRNEYENPTVQPAMNVDNDTTRSITDIFKKYKGEVIYVDFWASWCAPCRFEMPNAAILKEKLKGKYIVFLYFGYNDTEKAWLKARNQLGIQGEHYLLDEKMIKEADELFAINGIPHYAIIDKEGKIISKAADRPDDAYQQLLTLVSK